MKSTNNRIDGYQGHAAKYVKILDARKPPLRRLWQQNDRFWPG